MKIAVIGTGYVGLVTGVCLADLGNTVICVDRDTSKIDQLSQGIPTIYEPGLETLIKNNIASSRISFSTDTKTAIIDSDVIFIAVDTPPGDDGKANITNFLTVVSQIADVIKSDCPSDYKVIVNKSTVPVGTGEQVIKTLRSQGISNKNAEVVSNPEFLREGSAINDFFKPDRIILGGESEKALKIIEDVYRPLYLIETPIITSNIPTAELVKYASNAFLATKISFINEMSLLCEATGADVHGVAKGMGSDNRIGRYFLHPGPGYGGSCFPKDTEALVQIGQENNIDLKITKAAIDANERQKNSVVEKIKTHFNGSLDGLTIGVLGLSFKPNTDDMREAPSITIITKLQEAGARIQAFDPIAMKNASSVLKEVTFTESSYDVSRNADALVILTEWNEFREMNLEKMKELLASPVLFDVRNIYPPEDAKALGFTYYGTGRK
jgi:UDPglucose 6-dehydrogenase